MLWIPPYLASGDVDNTVLTEAAALCRNRRAFLIIDAPSAWDEISDAVSGVNAMAATVGTDNVRNAAVFFPRLRMPNPLRQNQLEPFASCGSVAGGFARTDAQRGVWKAPAGLDAELAGVSALTVPMTDMENGQLNRLGVNCLRTMPGTGPVIWGRRTLRGADRLADSDWKYIPVRRLALFMEESIFRGTPWAVFEPNDEPLWSQLRMNTGAFLKTVFRQGAFQGTSPRDAYFVKCDRSPAFVAGVSKVSSLKRTTEVVNHREGGDPSSTRKSPGRTEYEAITLERGVTHDPEFERWANKVWNYTSGLDSEVSLRDFRRDIRIEVYNEAGQLVLAYHIFRCWVSEFQARADLDANANAVLIRSIKLENEGWERDY